MDRLWAPWRYKYVQKKMKGCLFCKVQKNKKMDKKNFVVHRSSLSFSILNIYPYNNGHVMVAPYRHVKELSQLKEEEILDMMRLVSRTTQILKKLMRPAGFNVGINIGRKSGAGFAGHVHIHIVPRWDGDTNFMPVIAQTKVISQSLRILYSKLTNAHKKRNTRNRR